MDEAEEAVREFELDLHGADRGSQLRRRPHGMRIETKPQYADLLGRLLPGRKAKPITAQALEVLAIIALKQPVAIADINAIRSIESASTVETLAERGLIARSSRLGPRRARLCRTTQVFLESFGLASIDELYMEGADGGSLCLRSTAGRRAPRNRRILQRSAAKVPSESRMSPDLLPHSDYRSFS